MRTAVRKSVARATVRTGVVAERLVVLLKAVVVAVNYVAPEERWGMSDVSLPPCLESQGCHLIPLYYLPSCSSA